jgi:hypothetical protein
MTLRSTPFGASPLRDNRAVSRATDRTERMRVTTFPSLAAHDRADAAYWRSLSVGERVRQVWRLSEEQWRLRGEFPDEPGLCRSVARVLRA